MATYGNMQPNSPELIALCQSCDAFVLPTRAEAFGIAAVEATALGLPVIGTAVGGLPDIVAEGETGYVIPPGDVDALAAHLRRLAEDSALRQRMGRAARQRAEERFDARKNAARVIGVLEEVVKGSYRYESLAYWYKYCIGRIFDWVRRRQHERDADAVGSYPDIASLFCGTDGYRFANACPYRVWAFGRADGIG